VHDLLQAPPGDHPGSTRRLTAPFHAWLGEAIAIKDPTAAIFRPISGANLLAVGQQDDAALGMLATGMVSLAAQLATVESAPRFYILDGRPADASHRDLFKKLKNVVPHSVHVVGSRDGAKIVGEWAEERERRLKIPESETTPLFLIVFGLQRFRDLRRSEDDFAYSRRDDEKANPSQQFASLLHEGSALGIHTL